MHTLSPLYDNGPRKPKATPGNSASVQQQNFMVAVMMLICDGGLLVPNVMASASALVVCACEYLLCVCVCVCVCEAHLN